MKININRFRRLNQRGFSYEIVIGAIVVLVIAVIGVHLLYSSHADTPTQLVFNEASNTTGSFIDGIYTYNAGNSSSETVNAIAAGTTQVQYSSPSYSPDGTYLVWSTSTDTLQVYDTSTSKSVSINMPASAGAEPDLSGGEYIAAAWFPNDNDSKIAFVASVGPNQTSAVYTTSMTSSGTWTTPVSMPIGDNGNINGLAITGDGKYIVYSTTTGVYAVSTSSPNPSTTVYNAHSTQSCWDVIAQPSSAEGLAWICKGTGSTLVNYVYADTAVGGTISEPFSSRFNTSTTSVYHYYEIQGNGIAFSPNGSTIGVNIINLWGDLSNCTGTQEQRIMTVPTTGGSSGTIIESGVAGPQQCAGGGGPINNIAWSPTGSSIAYVVAYNLGDEDLYVVPAVNDSSPSFVAHDVSWLTW